ncbi:MAG TPA: 2-succinyl-5-enolpyruvyl-6-hydroxy-3-cyclohexene-1-carboxylic-acid synthase [Propionibacteriaceae bacterium]
MADALRCAQVVVDTLIELGVREVVLSPGSRSAPLAYALFEADQQGRLRLHVRIDERTAGFLALGLAKASEAPVAVLTTSGTATANLHPAVLEAWHSHLPLVVVTADRPRAVINTGANQTTRQAQLFADHVCAFAGLDDESGQERTWRFETTRLVAAALGVRTRRPGPVHLNVELHLEAGPTPTTSPPGTTSSPTRVGRASATAGPTVLAAGPRTVMLVGDARPEVGRSYAALAESAGVPVLAEPSSNARTGSAAIATYRLLLASPLAERIERVVMIGHPTLSRPVTRMLGRDDVELIVVTSYADWIDPGMVAGQIVDAVTFAVDDNAASRFWLEAWREADSRLGSVLTRLLEAQRVLTGPALAREVAAGLGAGDALFVGASNPIRDLDLAPIAAITPKVYANRGLSGIDGSISSAIGIALATGVPTHALIGDVTAVHDLTGLMIGADEPRPDLRLLIANDDGGSIFATLEQGADRPQAFERVFATPHGVRFEAVAVAAGVAYVRVHDLAGLRAVLSQPPVGIELVEVVVDRSGRRRLDAEITALGATL